MLSTPTSRPCIEPSHSCRRVVVSSSRRYTAARTSPLSHTPLTPSEPPASGEAPRVDGGTLPTGHTRPHSTPSPRTDIRRAPPPPRHSRKIPRARDLGGDGGEGGRGREERRDCEGERKRRRRPTRWPHRRRTTRGLVLAACKTGGNRRRLETTKRQRLPIAALGFPVDGVDRPDIRGRREHYSDAGSR